MWKLVSTDQLVVRERRKFFGLTVVVGNVEKILAWILLARRMDLVETVVLLSLIIVHVRESGFAILCGVLVADEADGLLDTGLRRDDDCKFLFLQWKVNGEFLRLIGAEVRLYEKQRARD